MFHAALATAVFGVVLAAPAAVTPSGAFFTDSTATDQNSVGVASLEPVSGVSATYGPDGTAEVSWTSPTTRNDVALDYSIERSVGGENSNLTPTLTSSGGATSFSDDLAVEPVVIDGKTVTAISAGGEHTCAIADGNAYCWGNGTDGQLGDGRTISSSAPVAVSGGGVLAGKTVTAISAGSEHTCAIADGNAYCWGNDSYGQLGDGTSTGSPSPVAVDTRGVLAGKTVTAISAGGEHTCAIAGGAAYCWGNGTSAQLGNYTFTTSFVPVAVDTSGVLAGKSVTAISAGNEDTCAIAAGAAYCWGTSYYGDLTSFIRLVPFAADPSGVLAGKTVTAISAGYMHVCAVADGAAYCWGTGSDGRLGNGTFITSFVPVAVDTSGVLAGKTVTAISAGNLHTCVIADGNAYCWGYGANGQLGNGTISTWSVPIPVSALSGKTVTSISAGEGHTCAVASDAAYCWGDGGNSGLGDGTLASSSLVPVAVDAGGALAVRECVSGWLPTADERCVPGPTIPVTYTIDYTQAGWSPPSLAQVTATWNGGA